MRVPPCPASCQLALAADPPVLCARAELPDALSGAASWAVRAQRSPLDFALHESGQWAMRWLVGCLCITPLKNATGAFWLHPLRQTFGLLAFGYSAIHGSLYALSDLGIGRSDGWRPVYDSLVADLVRRPYILFGVVGTSLMLVLAVTSYDAARVRQPCDSVPRPSSRPAVGRRSGWDSGGVGFTRPTTSWPLRLASTSTGTNRCAT